MRLLQVCNVGQITGGTAACAWTITRAFPDMRHTVAFLSNISPETHRVFAPVKLAHWPAVSVDRVLSCRPDFVLLHNIRQSSAPQRLPVPTLQYLHSRTTPAAADCTVYCSHWLRREYRDPHGRVLWQAVPRPLPPDDRPARDASLVVGRICTPHSRKWPPELIPLYADWAQRFPGIRWEFVGCPSTLRAELQQACQGRARFFAADWKQRSRLWNWDALLYHHPRLTESFGRTVTEAMRAGCLPIVDRRGGFIEQVPAPGGFLCNSPNDFQRALRAIHNPQQRRQRVQLCRHHADQNFSLQKFRTRLLHLLIAAHHRTARRTPPTPKRAASCTSANARPR